MCLRCGRVILVLLALQDMVWGQTEKHVPSKPNKYNPYVSACFVAVERLKMRRCFGARLELVTSKTEVSACIFIFLPYMTSCGKLGKIMVFISDFTCAFFGNRHGIFWPSLRHKVTEILQETI